MTDAQDILCPECGYDLRAAISPRCPECGQPVDVSKLRGITLPWEKRHHRNRLWAWLATLEVTLRRPREAMSRVPDGMTPRSARTFLATCSLAGALLAAASVSLPLGHPAANLRPGVFLTYLASFFGRVPAEVAIAGLERPELLPIAWAIWVAGAAYVTLDVVRVAARRLPENLHARASGLTALTAGGSIALGAAVLSWTRYANRIDDLLTFPRAGLGAVLLPATLETAAIVCAFAWLLATLAVPPWIFLRCGGARRHAVQVGVALLAWHLTWCALCLATPVFLGGTFWLWWISSRP